MPRCHSVSLERRLEELARVLPPARCLRLTLVSWPWVAEGLTGKSSPTPSRPSAKSSGCHGLLRVVSFRSGTPRPRSSVARPLPPYAHLSDSGTAYRCVGGGAPSRPVLSSLFAIRLCVETPQRRVRQELRVPGLPGRFGGLQPPVSLFRAACSLSLITQPPFARPRLV